MCKLTKGSFQRISQILLWIFGIALSFSQGQDVDWPSGSYGLPKPKSGCPISKTSVWSVGWRFQDMEDNSPSVSRPGLSDDSHFDNQIIGEERDINRTFCMKQSSSGVGTDSWPNGEYCIYKSGVGACPKNMLSGWVYWDDEDYRNQNKRGGSLPQGVYNENTKIYYCCQTNGNWYDSIELPVNRPFYLLTSNSVEHNAPRCQMVKWAVNRLEYINFVKNYQRDKDYESGEHVFIKFRRKVFYCYYEGCRRRMTNAPSGSFRSYQAPESRNATRSQYCSWLITTPETSVASLSFSEMIIPSCDDTFLRIYDGANEKAPLLGTYCGPNASKQVQISSSTNSLYVVANSGRIGKRTFSFQAHYYSGSLKDLDARRTTVSSGSFRPNPPVPVSKMNRYSQYCSWLITIPATPVVSLSFSEIAIPSCDDTFLRIYDGANRKAPLLGTYCGSNASTSIKITSSTKLLYIVANSRIYGKSEGDDTFLRIYDGANKEAPLFGTYCDSRSNASTEVVNITSAGNAVYVVANFGRRGKNGSQVFSFRAHYSGSFKDSVNEDRSRNLSKLVIIFSIVGLALVLILVIIVVLVKYKRRNAEPKSVAPVNIPLEKVENSEVAQEPMRSDVEMSTENYEDAPIHSDQVEDGACERGPARWHVEAPDYEATSEQNDDGYETVNVLAKSPIDKKAKNKTKANDAGYTALDPKKRETENDYEKLVK